MFQKFFNGLRSNGFQVTYWDYTTEKYGEGEPLITIMFYEEISFSTFAKNPDMTFCEAYMDGKIDIDGELEEIIKVVQNNRKIFSKNTLSKFHKLSSISKQKEEVQHHYDLGNDFYSLWLDETMSYSCAYFQSPNDSLYQAQLQKIDHVLKKLQLKPGETLLDIGSGWGWLIIRAAQNYGVKAMGITLSEEQYKRTQKRIMELGLEGRVEVELTHYRELMKSNRRFDKIASIGMFEHVGQGNYPNFMKTVQTLLNEKGLALLHTITNMSERPVSAWINKYIFPGGYIPSLREIVQLLPDYDFHTMDIESLRMHYAMTLDRWMEGFEKHKEQVKEMYGQHFVRMWRLYLHFSAASFRHSELDVHQILFSKGLNNDLKLTRGHLYL